MFGLFALFALFALCLLPTTRTAQVKNVLSNVSNNVVQVVNKYLPDIKHRPVGGKCQSIKLHWVCDGNQGKHTSKFNINKCLTPYTRHTPHHIYTSIPVYRGQPKGFVQGANYESPRIEVLKRISGPYWDTMKKGLQGDRSFRGVSRLG